MNTGELNELLVKLKLIELRDNKRTIALGGKHIEVKSVSFHGREFRSLPAGTSLLTLSATQIESLAAKVGASKAGLFDKADVYINGKGYSIKSLATAPPALVNHTNRYGWERVCKRVGCTIDELDTIIDQYWVLRKAGRIKEDVFNDQQSPFYSHKKYLIPILNYFLFKGTGFKDSSSPADYILDIVDPLDTSTWSLHGNDFLENNWDNLVFCVRAKKGMSNYPDISDKKIKDSIARWTHYYQREYRGALHVRFKNGK